MNSCGANGDERRGTLSGRQLAWGAPVRPWAVIMMTFGREGKKKLLSALLLAVPRKIFPKPLEAGEAEV